MFFPLFVAFASVSLGAWLALGPREGTRLVVPIRLASLVAAIAVIATHLLPEAWHALGVLSVAGFLAGIAVPSVAEAISAAVARRRLGAPPDRHGHGHDHGHDHGHGHDHATGHPGALAALEIGYWGLVVHRFGDGLSMGAIARSGETPWATAGVLLTLAAHIVPVTTVMVIAVAALRGRPAATRRAALLAASTMAGVAVAWEAMDRVPEDVSPWISAVVAGLLVHIVAHDVPWPGRTARATG